MRGLFTIIRFALISLALLTGILNFSRIAWAAPDGRRRENKYRPKNGVISLKGEIFGGEFRVTNIIPLHGDFSKFSRIEIVRLESLIGHDVPADVLNDYTNRIYSEFEKSGHFQQVVVVAAFHKPSPEAPRRHAADEDFKHSDALDAPMLSWEDLLANDRRRAQAARREAERLQDAHTLVVTGQVIDYAKGNKYLNLLPLDLGRAVFTVRFSYYDKETGEELGRQIISSESGSKLVPMLFNVRNTTVGLVEGVVDQISRREVSAER